MEQVPCLFLVYDRSCGLRSATVVYQVVLDGESAVVSRVRLVRSSRKKMGSATAVLTAARMSSWSQRRWKSVRPSRRRLMRKSRTTVEEEEAEVDEDAGDEVFDIDLKADAGGDVADDGLGHAVDADGLSGEGVLKQADDGAGEAPAMGLRRETAKKMMTMSGRSRMARRGKGLGRSACSRIAPSGTSSVTAGEKLCCSSSRRDV